VLFVNKDKGRVRIGYALGGGIFDWVDWREGGTKSVTGVSVAKLFDAKRDGIALVSFDGNQLTVIDAASATKPTDPVNIPVDVLGPNLVLALDIPGEGNTPLADLMVPSSLNADDNPNKVTLFRNSAGKFNQLSESAAPVAGAHGNVITLKAGGPVLAAAICTSDAGTQLLVGSLASGQPQPVLTISNVPPGADYVVGDFRGTGRRELVIYTPGSAEITLQTVTEAGGSLQAGPAKNFTLTQPVKQLVTVDGSKRSRLLAVNGEDQLSADLLELDLEKSPTKLQSLLGQSNKVLHAAIALPDSILLVSTATTSNRIVSHYQGYQRDGDLFKPGSYGSLAPLDDRDDATVPGIHGRVLASLTEKSEADMKGYTNMIPGTEVPYSMVAIRGGEFLMGSPESEAGRKPSEGPQHRVKISPFWMGQFEVTWEQYLLYMYPDDERKLRETFQTEADVNTVSDAVTRPTKPYVDMSFGMGKAGFPAIAMTQHGANKFCHWLSAKTGHFYRLPTEAEWEYACRAGTTTAYFFGNDPAMLEPGVSAGVIRESSGTVELQKAGAGEWLPAKVGQTLQSGDKLRTGSDSRALVHFAYQPKPSPVTEKSTVEVPVPDYLGEFAWYFSNANDKYQKVGQKRPNPWGLFDMHGNVREWTLDQFDENYYASLTSQSVIVDPWNRATKPYPHSSRGGSWFDDALELRSASRIPSTKLWKMTDPQLPKSRWWLSDATWIGIRLVRPLKVPTPEEMVKYWTSGVDKE